MARKHTEMELLQFIGLHLEGVPYRTLVEKFNLMLSIAVFMKYVDKYQRHGIEGIRYQKNNRRYTKEFKQQIVSEHLRTGYGFSYLAAKHNIPSETTVKNWIKRYTEGKENVSYSPNSEVYHMTSAKKTYEEKLQIVEDYISNRLTYKEAAEKHQVSYNNIYSWVNKYKKHGPKGLEDNRGRGKPTELQTTEERLNAEVETLKARNKWLEMENDALKKAPKDRWESQISGVRQEAEYLTVEELKHKYPVNHLCDILGIARSSYYKWLKREPSEAELKGLRLMRAIEGIHEAFGGIYGYRRMTIFLNFFRSAKVNHKCVHRLMKIMGITAVIRSKRMNYVPHKATHVADNILNREFHAEKPMEKLLTDVTEFRLTNGAKRYLSAIYDLGSKKIIAYQMSNRNDNPLVLNTMKQILGDVKPETTLIHSDRGSQYTSHAFNKMIKDNKMIHSMSRVSKCIDNGPMEGFWGTLKVEMFNLDTFDTPAYLDRKIKAYIAFFNNERITLDMGLAIPTEEKILQMIA